MYIQLRRRGTNQHQQKATLKDVHVCTNCGALNSLYELKDVDGWIQKEKWDGICHSCKTDNFKEKA